MARGDEITTKFKVDISDLKKGIADANQEIKLANAEFKAATAGMDDWKNSAEGITAKLQQLDSVLAAQKSKLASYTEELRRQEQAYNENGSKVEQLKAKLAELAANGVSKTSEEYKKYETALAACEREQDKNSAAIDRLKITVLNQQAAVNQTEAEIRQYNTALEETGDSAEELDQSLDELNDSAEQSGGGFDSMTVALGNLIAEGIQKAISAIKDFVKETVDIGINFDRSMSQVGAVSGATADELEQLRDKAKEMGETTKFSASDSADAFNYMAMAGWKTGDMLEGINGILSLAAAGNTDLATTSDIVTDALTAFGESADQAGRLADVMAAASSNANTNVQMMGETFKYVAPVAGSLGYSMEDTAVAIGLMANAGIKGSQAGTSLRSAITNMAKPTGEMTDKLVQLGLATVTYTNAVDAEKLKTAQDNFQKKTLSLEQAQIKYNAAVEKYGKNSDQAKTALINVQKATIDLQNAQEKLNKEQEGSIESRKINNDLLKDAEGNMRPFSEVIGLLREKFKDLNEEEQAQAAATLFGKEAMSGMLAIINASEEDFQKLTKAIDESGGSAEEMAKIMQDNLGGDLDTFHSKLESVQLNLYEKLEPALRSVIQALTGMLDGVTDMINKGAEFVSWLQGGSVGAEALKAVVVALAAAFGTLAVAMGIQSLIKGVQAAFVALNAVMAANPVGLVVAAIAALVAAFTYLWDTSEDFRNFWINLWEEIKKVVEPVWNAIVGFCKQAWEAIKQVFEPFVKYFEIIWDNVKQIFSAVESVFRGDFDAAWNAIKSIWDNVVQYFTLLWEDIKSVFAPVTDWFSEKFNAAREAVNNVWQDVGTWFGDRRKDIENALETVNTWFKDKFEDARKWTEQAFKDVGNWFADRRKDVEGAWQTVDTWMGDKFGGAWEAIKNAFKPFVDYFKMLWENVKDIYSAVESVFRGDFEGAWNAIKSIWDRVTGYFRDIWEGIKGIFAPVAEWFGSVFDRVGGAIKAPLNAVIRAMNTVIRGLNKISIDIPDWVPGVGGQKFGFNIGEIPELASGGILRKGQVGLLEGKGDEAVVPLDKNKAWIREVANDLLDALGSGAGGGVTGSISRNRQMNFTQNIYAPKQPSRIELYRQTRNLLAYANLRG